MYISGGEMVTIIRGQRSVNQQKRAISDRDCLLITSAAYITCQPRIPEKVEGPLYSEERPVSRCVKWLRLIYSVFEGPSVLTDSSATTANTTALYLP